MENKTTVEAPEGRADLRVTREFELPVELLFRAYSEASLLEQWMGTRVLSFENKAGGGYQFETRDKKGSVVFKAGGVIHSTRPNERIVRTFEMQSGDFEIQLEFLDFFSLAREKSRLQMHIVCRTPEHRDKILKMPFAFGINMAHNRLQEVASALKII